MKIRRLAWLALVFFICGCDPYQEGLDLSSQGKYEEAARFFLRLSKDRPTDARVFHELGYNYTRLKMYDKAADAYNKALALDPDYFEARANLGYVHLLRKRPSVSLKHLDRALELNPQCDYCHANLAWAHAHLGNIELAREHLAKAIELGGDKPEYREIESFIDYVEKKKKEDEKKRDELKKKYIESQTRKDAGPEDSSGPAHVSGSTAGQ